MREEPFASSAVEKRISTSLDTIGLAAGRRDQVRQDDLADLAALGPVVDVRAVGSPLGYVALVLTHEHPDHLSFDNLRAAGAPVLCLHTAEFMAAAVAMYGAAGFRRDPVHDFEATGELAGELRVGLLSTLAPYLLPLVIARFARRWANAVGRATFVTMSSAPFTMIESTTTRGPGIASMDAVARLSIVVSDVSDLALTSFSRSR